MSKKDKMGIKEGIPRQVNGKEAKLPSQGPWVPSMVGKLTSHGLPSQKNKYALWNVPKKHKHQEIYQKVVTASGLDEYRNRLRQAGDQEENTVQPERNPLRSEWEVSLRPTERFAHHPTSPCSHLGPAPSQPACWHCPERATLVLLCCFSGDTKHGHAGLRPQEAGAGELRPLA